MRSSSSTHPLASSAPLSRGPPSHCTNAGRRHDVAEAAQGERQVDLAAAGPHDVDAGGRGGPSSGTTRNPEPLVNSAVSVGTPCDGDDADAQPGLLRWPVALRPHRARPDEHDVGGPAQGAEHAGVGGVAEAAGAPVDDRRPVEAGDHADADPRAAGRLGSGDAVQLVDADVAGGRVDHVHEVAGHERRSSHEREPSESASERTCGSGR